MIKEIDLNKIHDKEMIFMMGAPGSGKSYVSHEYFNETHVILDADEYKKEHKDYDPENPQLVHQYSSIRLEEEFQKALLVSDKYVVDGTGANSDKMARRIFEAKSNGFKTILVYVIVSLQTSLKRNQQRERHVPNEVIIEKFKDIRFSFDIVSPMVDEVRTINNE